MFGRLRVAADKPTYKSVPLDSLDKALDWVKKGGRLAIPTATRVTVLDKKVLARFEKANEWLLKADGEGYRIRSGKGSLYCLPGQLRYVIEADAS